MKALFILTATSLLLFARANPQGRYTLSCNVENNDTTTIYHNQPLLFSISITNKNLYKDWQWNQAADEWIQKLESNFKTGHSFI